LSKPLFKPTAQPVAAAKSARDISKLAVYFGKSLKAGISRIKLREAALKEGWTDVEVNKAFGSFEKTKKQTDKGLFSLFKR